MTPRNQPPKDYHDTSSENSVLLERLDDNENDDGQSSLSAPVSDIRLWLRFVNAP